MTFDKDIVKERLSLIEVFDRDGHVLKRAGTAMACRCPVHEEKTSSCHVHEKEGYFKCFGCDFKGDVFVYWQTTRGVDFKTALKQLAGLAGISPEMEGAALAPKAPRPEPVEELATPMSGVDAEKWQCAVSDLIEDDAELERIATWRGFDVKTVRWAAQAGLMGVLPFMGARREAFLVERPGEDGMIPVGYHVRLAPLTPGNDHPKASWRYPWAGIGAWPFRVGDVRSAKVIFAVEGQWDALALVDLMGWEGVPAGVAVVGMRGATSWKRFLQFDQWPQEVTAFALADADRAGREWFAEKGFVEQLQPRCRRVWGFFPHLEGAKDFNDVCKARDLDGGRVLRREAFSMTLRAKMRRKAERKKVTFLQWCREQAGKRADEIGMAAFLVVRDKERPRGRKSLPCWERHWQHSAAPEHLPVLRAAWGEWMKAA